MSLPPPIPKPRPSPVVVIALLLVFFAALLCATIGSGLLEQLAGRKLDLAMIGTGAAALGVVFSIVALCLRGAKRALPALLLIASLGCFGYLGSIVVAGVRGAIARATGSHDSSTGATVAQQPIVPSQDVEATAARWSRLMTWSEAAMLRPYEEHGRHATEWDDAARRMIRGSAAELLGSPARPGVESLRILGGEIERKACDDPWVLFLVHRLGTHDPDHAATMEHDFRALQDADYGAFPGWLACAEAYKSAIADRARSAARLASTCLQIFPKAFETTLELPDAQAAWERLLTEGPGETLMEHDGFGVCKAIGETRGAAPWFTQRMRGRAEVAAAWQVRGDGYANSVKKQQWQGFEEHLQLARTALAQSWKSEPGEPSAAKGMITVAMGASDIDEMRLWFQRTVAARFDYIPAYDAFRIGLLPRWLGSEEALLAFGRACAATKRFDTEVPLQLLRSVQAIAAEKDDSDAYYRNEAPWEELKQMLDGYLEHGDSARRSYYLGTKAVLAQMRALDSLVGELVQQMNGPVNPDVAEEWNLPVEWVGRMLALSGPTADLALAAERAARKNPEKAREHLHQAQKLPGLLPKTSEYLTHRVAYLEATMALAASVWQPLLKENDLSAWKVKSGDWRLASPGVLEGKSGSDGAMIEWSQQVGDMWELRGEFELANEEAGRAEAAFFCGAREESEPHSMMLRCYARHGGPSGISLSRESGNEAVSKQTDFRAKNTFLIQMANQRLRVIMNGSQWYSDQPLPAGFKTSPSTILALGSTQKAPNIIRFRKLEWRTPASAH